VAKVRLRLPAPRLAPVWSVTSDDGHESAITAETDAAIRGDLTKGREAQPPIYTQSHLSNSLFAI
jgi:hypothetical protein